MNINCRSSLNENMIEISRTINSLKKSERSVVSQIENEENYREKLIEKLNDCKNQLNSLNGKIINSYL